MGRMEKVLLIAVGLFGVLLMLGNFHFINGKNIGFTVAKRASFGFSEMFINVDQITGMPYIAARTQYPLGCQVLARIGVIESDEAFQARVRMEEQAEMHKAMQEAQQQQEAYMRSMGY